MLSVAVRAARVCFMQYLSASLTARARVLSCSQDHKNPILCAKGNIGFLLLHRYFVLMRLLPDFLDPQSAFKVPLFSNVAGDKPVPYEAQAKWCTSVYNAIAASPGSCTHHWRGLSARKLAKNGVPEEEAKLILHHLELNVHSFNLLQAQAHH
jgi:hypothetical protein